MLVDSEATVSGDGDELSDATAPVVEIDYFDFLVEE